MSTRGVEEIKPNSPGVKRSNVSRLWQETGSKFVEQLRAKDLRVSTWCALMLERTQHDSPLAPEHQCDREFVLEHTSQARPRDAISSRDRSSQSLAFACVAKGRERLPPDLRPLVTARTHRGPGTSTSQSQVNCLILPDFNIGEVWSGQLVANSNPTTYVFTRETLKSFNNEWDIPMGWGGGQDGGRQDTDAT